MIKCLVLFLKVGIVSLFGIWTVRQVFSLYCEFRKSRERNVHTSGALINIAPPLALVWITVLYFLTASFDYAFYALRKSRFWRRYPVPSVVLTRCSDANGLFVFEATAREQRVVYCDLVLEAGQASCYYLL